MGPKKVRARLLGEDSTLGPDGVADGLDAQEGYARLLERGPGSEDLAEELRAYCAEDSRSLLRVASELLSSVEAA